MLCVNIFTYFGSVNKQGYLSYVESVRLNHSPIPLPNRIEVKEIKLIIDNDVVEKYNQYYFSQHPKARKKAIEHSYHPSINIWMVLPRIQMNALKQKWKLKGEYVFG